MDWQPNILLMFHFGTHWKSTAIIAYLSKVFQSHHHRSKSKSYSVIAFCCWTHAIFDCIENDGSVRLCVCVWCVLRHTFHTTPNYCCALFSHLFFYCWSTIQPQLALCGNSSCSDIKCIVRSERKNTLWIYSFVTLISEIGKYMLARDIIFIAYSSQTWPRIWSRHRADTMKFGVWMRMRRRKLCVDFDVCLKLPER